MHINVIDILADDIGASKSFVVKGERPKLEDIKLTSDLDGEAGVLRTEDGLILTAWLQTAMELECHRCLRAFSWPATIRVETEFGPDADLPVPSEQIDLDPLVREELILAQPIQIVCEPQCPGLCVVCGQRHVAAEHHKIDSVKHQPRIKKGK